MCRQSPQQHAELATWFHNKNISHLALSEKGRASSAVLSLSYSQFSFLLLQVLDFLFQQLLFSSAGTFSSGNPVQPCNSLLCSGFSYIIISKSKCHCCIPNNKFSKGLYTNDSSHGFLFYNVQLLSRLETEVIFLIHCVSHMREFNFIQSFQ